ncbi:hypothetical protein [Mangrovicoccus ximenensis]|uniref:hypothetical protein n=1 Tax=Mangrovicoccus ximenensis TaxID=1911570 RepID=UPI000D331D6D|nr:hypothetical protein [Mangrovicoccus ximenensis]
MAGMPTQYRGTDWLLSDVKVPTGWTASCSVTDPRSGRSWTAEVTDSVSDLWEFRFAPEVTAGWPLGVMISVVTSTDGASVALADPIHFFVRDAA